MDRLKQADEKKRCLEKALATSAAIRSELKKKKQKKKEEQQSFLHARRTSMDNLTCKSPPVLRKVMKKQGKYEMDRVVKKKRRLEKALAMSAAIRSELEKKKQQKKEEAVALHVHLGEEDTDRMFVDATSLNNRAEFLMLGRQETRGEFEGNFTDLPCSSGACVEEGCGWSRTELCPGLLAVSFLQIRDDANLNSFFVDRVLRG